MKVDVAAIVFLGLCGLQIKWAEADTCVGSALPSTWSRSFVMGSEGQMKDERAKLAQKVLKSECFQLISSRFILCIIQ